MERQECQERTCFASAEAEKLVVAAADSEPTEQMYVPGRLHRLVTVRPVAGFVLVIDDAAEARSPRPSCSQRINHSKPVGWGTFEKCREATDIYMMRMP